MYPLIMGFSIYGVSLLFETLEEITFYYYYLTCLTSIVLVYFFGGIEYNNFVPSGRHAVGCIETITKMGQNRVLIYYPTKKDSSERYPDYKWAMDGDHILKGLVKFAADLVPQNPFYHITHLKLNVRVKAPILNLDQKDKHGGKFIPIIFSHGMGCTTTFFSAICKDMASHGHIVYAIEHKDQSALHYFNDKGDHKYLKNMDMRDVNAIVTRLGIRVKEVDQLISEMNFITKGALGNNVELDLENNLTIMGHGFGATTAITMASKDPRIKKVVSYDPWLFPVKEQIYENVLKVP
jgi:platelet-activating factor acetylhydrolase